MTDFDVIVIGSGPGGYETASAAATRGWRTMIVERDLLGGTCLNRGCIPTKALCRSAELALDMRRSAELGVLVDDVTLDYARAAARKDSVVASLREGVALELRDVAVVYGEARFVAPRVIEVNGEEYSAPRIIVATGSRPATLDIPGAELAVNSDFLLAATELPESAVIIGGGVIGIEFASIFNAFGVKVTVLEYCKEILPGMDAEIAKRLRMALKRRGITIVTSAQVTGIRPGLTVEYSERGKIKSVDCSQAVMAVGRRAVIPAGLTEQGAALDRGFLAVDSRMATTVPGVYAVGDVNGLCLLAHAASAQGRVALGLSDRVGPVPSAVFSHPECASVGETEQSCRDAGRKIMVGTATYRSNGKAMAIDEPDGMVKIVADAADRKIIGCQITGAHAADIVQEVTVAIAAGMTIDSLSEVVHIHPTLSELVVRALGAMRETE